MKIYLFNRTIDYENSTSLTSPSFNNTLIYSSSSPFLSNFSSLSWMSTLSSSSNFNTLEPVLVTNTTTIKPSASTLLNNDSFLRKYNIYLSFLSLFFIFTPNYIYEF